jgi:putative transposase
MTIKQNETPNKQHRYPWPVIEIAVQMYLLQEGETFRSVAEKMLACGVYVTHKTVYEWVQKFSDMVSKTPHRVTSFSIEESYVKCNNEWMFMYRAHNSRKATLGVFLRPRRSIAAAKSFFSKNLA